MGDRSVTFKLVASRRPNRAMAVLHEHYAPGADTGADMLTKYKETSRGGLAVNVIEC